MKRKILGACFLVAVLYILSLIPALEELQIVAGVILGVGLFFAFLFSVVWVIRKAWKS